MSMVKKVNDTEDIRVLTESLSSENKKYVIAVAQALLYTQKRGERTKKCKPSGRKIV